MDRWVTAAHFVALTLVIIITPTRIGHWFHSFGMHLRDMGVGGMFLLGLMVGECISYSYIPVSLPRG